MRRFPVWPTEWPAPLPPPTCDHAPLIADLRQQVTALTAENASLTRENSDLLAHRRALADQVDELTRLNQSHDRGLARVPTTEPGVGRTGGTT